jgi:uncharacterized SAM-binding protein YcdF (DUF218 family)
MRVAATAGLKARMYVMLSRGCSRARVHSGIVTARLLATWPRRLALGLAVVLAFAVVTATAWLPLLGTVLVLHGEPKAVDAIVWTYSAMGSRGAEEVTRLYREGWSSHVVLSDFPIGLAGLDTDHVQPLARRELQRRGLPDQALFGVSTVPTSEFEEVLAVRSVFASSGWRSAIIVVSEPRARRALMTFRAALGEPPPELIPRTISTPGVDLGRWWTTRGGVDAVMHEWPRIVYYWAMGRF